MRILIRIVFVIFIANGIDCLGGVCDDCCDCLKEKKEEEKKGENNDEKKDEENKDEKKIMEYEEIEEDEINTAISLVNDDWYKAKEKNKENNLVLKIFKKKEDNAFQSKENGDKISIKRDKGNSKIEYLNGSENKLKLGYKKYALFEIKTKEEKTVYLYCSDVETIEIYSGIFSYKDHKSISVIACDTEKITNMAFMFCGCSNLKELKFGKYFNTTNVTNMKSMFDLCSSLTELDLKNFNTTKATDMSGMFSNCSSLKKLDLQNFNTTNVAVMKGMFYFCKSLENLNFGKNFNTTKGTDIMNMFDECNKLSADIKIKILGENE